MRSVRASYIGLAALAIVIACFVSSGSDDHRFKIVVLGDSISLAPNVVPDERYVTIIGDRVSESRGPVEVINSSVVGNTSADALARLPTVDLQSTDLFIVALGTNDWYHRVAPSELERNLREILRIAREHVRRVLVVGSLPPDSYPSEYRADFARIFSAAATDAGAKLVPAILEGIYQRKGLTIEDGIHPTGEGQRVIANRVWAALLPLLGEVAGTERPHLSNEKTGTTGSKEASQR